MADKIEWVVPTGRRAGDPRIVLTVYPGRMASLALTGAGERSPALMLTPEQVGMLEGACGELAGRLLREPEAMVSPYAGEERRARHD